MYLSFATKQVSARAVAWTRWGAEQSLSFEHHERWVVMRRGRGSGLDTEQSLSTEHHDQQERQCQDTHAHGDDFASPLGGRDRARAPKGTRADG